MRRRTWWVVAAVGLALVAAASPAPGAAGPQPDSSDHRASPPGGGARNEPTVAVHPRNPSIVASASHERQGRTVVSVNLSSDSGSTWPHRSVLPTVPGGPLSADPHLAFDTAGRLHAAYMSYNSNASGLDYAVGGLVVARSADGRRWPDEPTYVVRNRRGPQGCAFADFPALAADPRPGHQDTLYVAWQSLEYDDEQCRDGYRHPVYLARSGDGGRSWSRPVVMPVPVELNPYIPTVVVGPTGAVHVTFAALPERRAQRCDRIGAVDVHVATSTDGGRTLRDSVAMSDVCVPGVLHANLLGVQASLNSATGSTWRLLASTNTAVDPRTRRLITVVGSQDPLTRQLVVQVAASDDGGGTWQPAARGPLAPLDNAQFPRVASGPHGVAMLFLAQRPGGSFVAQGTSSRDGGRSWTPPLTLSTVPSLLPHRTWFNFLGDYLGLAVGRDGLAHPVWTDLREVPTGQDQAIYTRSFGT